MLSLFNIPSNDPSRIPQRHSQSMFYFLVVIENKKNFSSVFSNSYNILLPIKPKPLLYPKDSTLMFNSRHNSKSDQIVGDNVLVSLF